MFRVLKYSIRLVSPTVQYVLCFTFLRQYMMTTAYSITNIPLTAFVVEDMMEFVQAHASYRFVIRDEEDELPRILVGVYNLTY